MSDQEEVTKGEKFPMRPLRLKSLSQFFYQNSSFLIGIFSTAIFISYLFFVMVEKSSGFELADDNIKSLGTSFGFDHAEIITFLATRTDEMIKAYINFNQVWDTLFGLIYGLMYVVWISVLFKEFSQKMSYLNLLPCVQVLFDWLENYALALLANQYLAEGVISSTTAKIASIFSITKWVFSSLTLTLVLIGIILMISRLVKSKQ